MKPFWLSDEPLPEGIVAAEGFVAASHDPRKPIEYDVQHVELGNVVWLDEVEEERLEWLWRGYIPLRKVTILDGDPGLGKSLLTLDIAARLSSGALLPMEQPPPSHTAMPVLIVSAEDDLRDTIKPRLRAAGAEMSNIASLTLRRNEHGNTIPFSVPEDIPRLINALGESEARFCVIDPITAFLSERIQSHNDASLRKAMTPLAQLAQEREVALLLLRHLNKDSSVTKALYRGGGSIGFAGAARSVLLAAEKPDARGVMVLAQTKTNLARKGMVSSLEWRVVSWDDDPDVACVEWLGLSPLSADELLRRGDGRTDDYARREAESFLREELAVGPRDSESIVSRARDLGISQTTLKRARAHLDIHSYRARDEKGLTTKWFVHLPNESVRACDRCREHGR
jgi:hypothetical protein